MSDTTSDLAAVVILLSGVIDGVVIGVSRYAPSER
jgi:hypothetical protein